MRAIRCAAARFSIIRATTVQKVGRLYANIGGGVSIQKARNTKTAIARFIYFT